MSPNAPWFQGDGVHFASADALIAGDVRPRFPERGRCSAGDDAATRVLP
jgi:hypothetical protein